MRMMDEETRSASDRKRRWTPRGRTLSGFSDAPRRGPRAARLLAPLAMCLTLASVASAQLLNYAETGEPPESGLELLQEEPHDLIFFEDSAGGGWVKARKLPFPGRQIPEAPTGRLKIEVLGIEDTVFTAKWSDIERIELWEDRLEREARERIGQGDFASAYPFLAVLIRDYPNRPGLRSLRIEYLWNDARRRAADGQLGASLAMLEELRRYAPDHNPENVLRAIGRITDEVLTRLVDEGELDQAQQLLARLKDEYGDRRLSSVARWDEEFLDMAKEKQEQAIAARDAEDYRAARQLARDSASLSPNIPGGQELIREIDTIYPLINVGVLQAASEFDPTRIDNWGARRSGRLLYRTLFEMQEAGPEGGVYDFLFGRTEHSPDRMQFDMLLEPERLPEPLNRVDAFHVADVLAERARSDSPYHFSPWAAAIDAIGLDGPKEIRCRLRRPNLLPAALLQVTVDGSWFGGEPESPTGDYRHDGAEGNLTRYVLTDAPKTESQPRELVENRYESATTAVAALLKGEVDVVDQLFPSDAARLRESSKIRVGTYPLPTVHMLIPCSDHPYLAERTFRRALVYGTHRDDILQGELLERNELPGCQVLSGPFPAGVEQNDPLGYAYDRSIAARDYEPRLAKLLITMNQNQMKSAAARREEELPEMRPIRLAFPPNNLARIACEAIRSQWQLLDLDVELVELPVGRSYPEEGTADIVYVAAAVWEPILDARRVLGPEGLAHSNDQLIGLGLRRLEQSRNWKDARDRLLDLHSITHHELPILPLWQLVDSYAYRRELVGIGTDIVSLYQNANRWRLDR